MSDIKSINEPEILAPRDPPLKVVYVVIICTVIVSTVLGLVLVLLVRPHDDNTALNAQVLGLLAPTIASILAYGRSQQNAERITELHHAVNGNLQRLIQQTAVAAEMAAHAASVAQGHAEGMMRGIAVLVKEPEAGPKAILEVVKTEKENIR